MSRPRTRRSRYTMPSEEDVRREEEAKRRRREDNAPPPIAPLPTASFLQASPDGPLPPPTAWANAPSDLLVPLFTAVPLRPLILVLSVICKRWRAIALAIPASLPPLRPMALKAALAVLTNVTALRELHTAMPPSGLKELHVGADSTAKERQLPGLTALTSLSLDLAAPRALLEAFIPADAVSGFTNVTSLTLYTHGTDQFDHWPSGCLPRLASLSVYNTLTQKRTGSGLYPLHRLLLMHASTLTSLRIADPLLNDAVRYTGLTLLHLHHLHCPQWESDMAAKVPSLQTLGVSSAQGHPKYGKALPAATLVELDVSGEGWPYARWLPPTFVEECMRPTVHTLGLKHFDLEGPEVYPHVRNLKIANLDPVPYRRLDETFPGITSLTVLCRYGYAQLALLLQTLAEQRLKLRTLHVTLDTKSPKGDALRALGDSLCKLEARGVWCISVKADSACKELRELAARFRWLDVDVIAPVKPRVR